MNSEGGDKTSDHRGGTVSSTMLWALFGALALTIVTDEIGLTTTPLFVDSISSNVSDLTVVFALGQFPAAVLSFLAGPLIDRFDRRKMLMTIDAIAGASLAVAAWVAYRPDGAIDPLPVIFAVTFIVGGVGIVYRIAVEAFLPELVPRDQLARANSVVLTTTEVATLVGPALAGIFAAGIGFWAGYASNTLGAVVALVVFAFLRKSLAGPGDETNAPVESDDDDGEVTGYAWTAGVQRVFADPVLRWALIAAIVANAVAGFLLATVPVLARELMGISSVTGFGFIFSAAGLGGIVGGFAAGVVGDRIHSGKLLIGVIGVLAAMLALIWAVESPVVGALAIALISGTGVIASIHIRTLRQQRAPAALMGRVIAAFRGITIGVALLGALSGGWLVEALDSYRQAFGWIVLVTIAATVVLMVSPLRTIDTGGE